MTKFPDRKDKGYSAILGELKRCVKGSPSKPGTVHFLLELFWHFCLMVSEVCSMCKLSHGDSKNTVNHLANRQFL